MIQVKVVSLQGDHVNFGPAVDSLEQARTIVKVLDWMSELEILPRRVDFYSTLTQVIAIQVGSNDVRWNYKDGDPTGATDGIWDRD